jgi:hypothetical protein
VTISRARWSHVLIVFKYLFCANDVPEAVLYLSCGRAIGVPYRALSGQVHIKGIKKMCTVVREVIEGEIAEAHKPIEVA